MSAGYFGDRGVSCYGRQHVPRSPGDHGVVIVNDFAYRGMCTFWTFRRLAERLADSGHLVLRFDLPGTGDSPPVGSNRVDAWQAAVEAAVDHLGSQRSIERVTVIGFGIGALLALNEAQRNPKVAAVELIQPFLDGDRYVAFVDQTEIARRVTKTLPNGRLVGDHYLAKVEEASLRKLAAVTRRREPGLAIHLVAMEGDDSSALEKQLLETGAECRRDLVADAARWLEDPMSNVIPGFFDDIAARLVPNARTSHVATTALRPRHALPDEGFVEQAWACPGPGGPLHGVLTTPITPSRPAALVLFFGTAANRHSGMHDSNTAWARSLAQAGLATLRFDASGFGDSRPSPGFPDNEVLVDRNYKDGYTVLAELRRHGFSDFGVSGVSSGGFSAFKVALTDPSVRAFFGIGVARFVEESLEEARKKDIGDGRWYLAALRNPETWSRLLTGKVNARHIASNLLRRVTARARTILKLGVGRRRSSGPVVLGQGHRDMLALLDRPRSSVHLVYAEEDKWVGDFEREFGPRGVVLEGKPNVGLTFLANADHAMSDPADMARVAELARAFFARALDGQ